jgi:molybdenum-dependent DNA-binding transcriptional regulator ModE
LLRKYEIVAFYLGGKEQSVQAIGKQLVNAWDKMEAEAKRQFKKNIAGAFIVRPRGGRIDRIPLTDD